MSTSLVAEYLSFNPSFPYHVATNRVNEATYLDSVTMLLHAATEKRMSVATLVYFVAKNRCSVASYECIVASIRCNVAMNRFNVAMYLCDVAMKRCNVAGTSFDEELFWSIVATFRLVATP